MSKDYFTSFLIDRRDENHLLIAHHFAYSQGSVKHLKFPFEVGKVVDVSAGLQMQQRGPGNFVFYLFPV